MNITKEMIIIFTISLIGIFINTFIPIPASIIALLILVGLLLLKLITHDHIKITADFFLKYMPLFFVPSAVKIMVDYHFITSQLLSYIVVVFASTILTFFVSGTVVKILMKASNK